MAPDALVYHFSVEGGVPLSGTVEVQSAKNAAVALLAAALLNRQSTTLRAVPRIEEMRRLVEVATSLGAQVEWEDDASSARLRVEPPERFTLENLDAAAAQKTRSALLFLPALLSRNRQAALPLPGGCRLGDRSILPHTHMLEAFGVAVRVENGALVADASNLRPADVVLLESGDTVTEHALLVASLAQGESVIRYASANYMVCELAHFLRQLGISVEGIGTTTLRVRGLGAAPSREVEHFVGEDPTDAMFFLAAGLVTGGTLTIRNAPLRYLEEEIAFLRLMGARVSVGEEVRLSRNGITELVDLTVEPSDLVASPLKIHPRPYPGLNIDNFPFFAVIATQAQGETLLHDWVYEKRAIYYTELERLGASTLLLDPHRLIVRGRTPLKAAEIVAPPALRPASVLLIGMLGAEGKSQLRHVYTIKRGYEALAERLRSLGARITLHAHEADAC